MDFFDFVIQYVNRLPTPNDHYLQRYGEIIKKLRFWPEMPKYGNPDPDP